MIKKVIYSLEKDWTDKIDEHALKTGLKKTEIIRQALKLYFKQVEKGGKD